jgi:hypothetical protein
VLPGCCDVNCGADLAPQVTAQSMVSLRAFEREILLNVVVITNVLLLDEFDWNCSFLRLTVSGCT